MYLFSNKRDVSMRTLLFFLTLATVSAQPAAANSSTAGLEILEGDSVITVIDIGPQDQPGADPKFAMHCWTKTKRLTVSAPASQLGVYAKSGRGELSVSGQSFSGSATLKTQGGKHIELSVALTPSLLAAVASASTARVILGDGFAESNLDTRHVFKDFAQQCSVESGLVMSPLKSAADAIRPATHGRCSQEQSHATRSQQSQQKSVARFVNIGQRALKVFWLDYSGNRKFYANLHAGQSYQVNTFETHPWLIVDENNHCVGVYYADRGIVVHSVR